MVNSRTRRSAISTVCVALISITVASDLLPSENDDSSIALEAPQHASNVNEEGGVIAQSRHSHLRRHHRYDHHRQQQQHLSFLSRIVSLVEGRLFPSHIHGESEKDGDKRFMSRKHSAIIDYDYEIMAQTRALQQDTDTDVTLLDTTVPMATKAEEQWYVDWFTSQCTYGNSQWGQHVFHTQESCCRAMLSWIPIASCLTKNNGMQPMLTNYTKDYDPCPPAFVSGTNYKSRDVVSIPNSPGSESGEVYMCKVGAARLYCNIYPPTWKRLSPDGQTAHLIQDLGWEKKGKCGDPLPTMSPTQTQTEWPTMSPTQTRTEIPSIQSSEMPSMMMTEMPSAEMTEMPSKQITAMPSKQITEIPSAQITAMPSAQITSLLSTQTTELTSTQGDDPQVTMRPTMRPSPVPSMGVTKPVGGRTPLTLSPEGSSPSTTPSPTVTSPSAPTSGGTNPTSTSTNGLGPSTITSGGYTGGTSPSITSFISNQSPSHAYQPSHSGGIPSALSSPVGASTLAPTSSSVEKTAPAPSVDTSPTTSAPGMTYFTDGRSKPAGGRRSNEPDEENDSFSSSPELTSPYGVIKFTPSKEEYKSNDERLGLNEENPIGTNEGRYKIFKSPQDDREAVIHEEDDDFIQIRDGEPHCWRSGTECNSYAEDFACCTGGCVDGYCQ